MAGQAPEGRAGRLAAAAGIALLLVGLTLLLEPASRRAASARLRTPMERQNDAAFLVVVSAVALIVVRLARPWTAALPGLVGGFLIGWSLRPRPTQPEAPQARSATQPGKAETSPDQAEEPGTSPGQAGTPRPGAGAPESGG